MKSRNTALGKTVTLCKSIGIVIGKCYLGIGTFYLLAIGLWAKGIDGNVCSFTISHSSCTTHPVPWRTGRSLQETI